MMPEAGMAGGPFKETYRVSQGSTRSVSHTRSKFDSLWPVYESILKVGLEEQDYYLYMDKIFRKADQITELYTNDDINTFLQSATIYEKDKYYDDASGIIASKMLHNLYKSGQCIIGLDLSGIKPIELLGWKLRSRTRKPLTVIVQGELCGRAFQQSSGTFFIENAGHDTAVDSEGTYYLRQALDGTGEGSFNAKFLIQKQSGEFAERSTGRSYGSKFYVKSFEQSRAEIVDRLEYINTTIYSPQGFHKQDHPHNVDWQFKYISPETFDRKWERAEYVFTHMHDIVKRGYI